MSILLFNTITETVNFYPLSLTRPVGDLRIGIFKIREKWEKHLNQPVGYFSSSYLSEKYQGEVLDKNIFINGSVMPNQNLVQSILKLKNQEGLILNGKIIAVNSSVDPMLDIIDGSEGNAIDFSEYGESIRQIEYPWHIASQNGIEIGHDLKLIAKKENSILSDKNTIVYAPENLFLEDGANVKASIIDGSNGPIYIAKGVEIQPGSIISGPCALLIRSTIAYGSKIRQNTTIGPHCKVGGEINNVVFQGHSNKSHDGFLGTSVIGEWCNFGAGSNNSNLKNNYGNVKVWNYNKNRLIDTGEMYSGLIMGDHSKCGISTMFNTGTVVGVGANVFGSGYMPKFIPSFSWGGNEGFKTYDFNKAIGTAKQVTTRRNIKFNSTDEEILRFVFNLTSRYRTWESEL